MSAIEDSLARLEKAAAAEAARVAAHEANLQAAVTELNAVVAQLTTQGTVDAGVLTRLSTLADNLDAFDPDVPPPADPAAPTA